MLEIKLEDSHIMAMMEQLKAKTGNMRPVLSDLGEKLVETTKQRFDEGRGPDGETWAPNKESTIGGFLSQTKGNYKKKNKGLTKKGQERKAGKKPLLDSRNLMRGIHKKVTSDTLRVGSNAIQSRVMQFGAAKGAFGKTKYGVPVPWGDIPGRPYIGFSDEDRSIILETIKKRLES